MKELLRRTLFGALYTAVIFAGVWFHPVATFLLTGLMAVIALRELSNLFNNSRIYPGTWLATIGLWAFSGFQYLSGEGFPELTGIIVGALILLILNHLLSPGSEFQTKRLGSSITATVYIGIPMALGPWISLYDNHFHPILLLGVFILIWTNDSFAYLIGKPFGKHPLIPRLSPKKSVEGLLGGLLFAVLAAYLLAVFTDSPLATFDWLIIGFLVVLGSTAGDLLESALKRSAGVKDSGKLIPGHGGLLDRIDSFLIVVPLVWLYLQF